MAVIEKARKIVEESDEIDISKFGKFLRTGGAWSLRVEGEK